MENNPDGVRSTFQNLLGNFCNKSVTNMGPAQSASQRPASGVVGPGPGASRGFAAMDSGDWRNHLEPGFRLGSLRRIVQGLISHYPGVCDEARLNEFKRIALRIEGSFYSSANSLSEYLTRLSQMMHAIVAKARKFARNPFDKSPVSPQNDKASVANSSGAFSTICGTSVQKHHLDLDGNLQDNNSQQPVAKPLIQQVVPSQQSATAQDQPLERLIRALKSRLTERPVDEKFKRRRPTELDEILLKEINKINEKLIDTVVEISKQGVDHEGTIVYCRFKAVSLSQNLKSLYELAPFQPISLLIPENYPNRSPVWLEDFPVEASGGGFCEEPSVKARSRFRITLRILSEPMSIAEIARAWDVYAREAISEFTQQYGGCSFSNKYGGWKPRDLASSAQV